MIEFLVLGLSAAITFVLLKSRYNYAALEQLEAEQDAAAPDLTVVIPARNEAHQIARAVRSFAGFRVIVVDDHSSDGTAESAREAGAEVLAAPPLPKNAKGKPNACAAAARTVTSKWILFVDADTWFERGFVESLAAYAERHSLDAVTAFLRQHTETFAEKALLPYAFALYFTGVSANNIHRAGTRECLANGQCLLFKRSAYERIGGHSSVIESVIEDVALAQRAKKMGVTLRVIRAERLGHVRMYDGARSIWRGFEKNSFRFLLINPWSGLQVVVSSMLITSWLPVLVLAYRDLPEVQGRWELFFLSPAGILFLLPFVLLLPWYGASRALFAPVGIYLFQLIALNGMLVTLTGRKSIWKERHV